MLEVSGFNCQPWSAAGIGMGCLDGRSLPSLILTHVIMHMEPDGVCVERTPRFDSGTTARLVASKYSGSVVITCPTSVGCWWRERGCNVI